MTTRVSRGVSVSGDLVAAVTGGCLGLGIGWSLAHDLSTPGLSALGATVSLMGALALSIGVVIIAAIVSRLTHWHGPALLAIAAIVAMPGTLLGTAIGPKYEPSHQYRATVALTIERPQLVELVGAADAGTCSTYAEQPGIAWVTSTVGRIGPDALEVMVNPMEGTLAILTNGGTYRVEGLAVGAVDEGRSGTVTFASLSAMPGTRPLRLGGDATRLAGRIEWSCRGELSASDTPALIPGASPPNDSVAGARLVSTVPFEDVVDISAATLDRGEAVCSGHVADGALVQGSVWYAIPAPAGRLLVEASLPRERASLLAVYGPFSALPSTLPSGPPSCVGQEQGSLTTTTLEGAGGTYLVGLLIAGMMRTGEPENLWVHVGRLPPATAAPAPSPSAVPSAESTAAPTAAPPSAKPPKNDDLASAIVVTTLPYDQEVNLTGANLEPGEPRPCANGSRMDRSVWYVVTMPSAGRNRVEIGQVQDAVTAAVYGPFPDGWPTDPAGLGAPRWCVNGSGPSKALTEQVGRGDTYLIQLTTNGSVTTTALLRLDETEQP